VRWPHPRLGNVPPGFLHRAGGGNRQHPPAHALGAQYRHRARRSAGTAAAARCASRSTFPRATSTTPSCRSASSELLALHERAAVADPARGDRERDDGQARRRHPRAAPAGRTRHRPGDRRLRRGPVHPSPTCGSCRCRS
jgi:hypothetical protein